VVTNFSATQLKTSGFSGAEDFTKNFKKILQKPEIKSGLLYLLPPVMLLEFNSLLQGQGREIELGGEINHEST
jgi:hypothetical protein